MQSLEQSGQSLRFAMVSLCSSYVGRGRESVRNVYSEQLIQIYTVGSKTLLVPWYPRRYRGDAAVDSYNVSTVEAGVDEVCHSSRLHDAPATFRHRLAGN